MVFGNVVGNGYMNGVYILGGIVCVGVGYLSLVEEVYCLGQREEVCCWVQRDKVDVEKELNRQEESKEKWLG